MDDPAGSAEDAPRRGVLDCGYLQNRGVYIILLAAIIFAGVVPRRSRLVFGDLTQNFELRSTTATPKSIAINQTQAKFVNLDGKVQVKKVNSVQWVEADFHTALDKGDLVQTGSDGVARITFADGTFYTR